MLESNNRLNGQQKRKRFHIKRLEKSQRNQRSKGNTHVKKKQWITLTNGYTRYAKLNYWVIL